jgi:hypothetical protein
MPADSTGKRGRARADARRIVRAYRRKLYDRHRSDWFAMPLDGALDVPPPHFDARLVFDCPVRVLDFIRRLDIPGTFDPVEIRSMHARGHLFVGLEEAGTMVGFAKLGWDTVYVLDYRIDLQLPAGDFFVIESFVIPERRGLGAGAFLVQGTNREMLRRGFVRRIAHVLPDNTPMLRTATRVGYQKLGSVDFISVCGQKIFRPHPAVLLDTPIARAVLAPVPVHAAPPSPPILPATPGCRNSAAVTRPAADHACVRGQCAESRGTL